MVCASVPNRYHITYSGVANNSKTPNFYENNPDDSGVLKLTALATT